MYTVKDIRNYINNSLLKKENFYNLPIVLKVTYYPNGSMESKEVEVLYIKRNSESSRPRLFGSDNKPVELSYCNVSSLSKEFMRLREHLHDEAVAAKKAELIKELTAHEGNSYYNDIVSFGVNQDLLIKYKDTDWNEGMEVSELQQVCNNLVALENIKKRVSIFQSVEDYNSLSFQEKVDYYVTKGWLESSQTETIFARTLEKAVTFGVDVPVVDEIWDKHITSILNSVKEAGFHKFYYIERSSSTLETIYQFITEGWSLSGITEVSRTEMNYTTKYKTLIFEYVG